MDFLFCCPLWEAQNLRKTEADKLESHKLVNCQALWTLPVPLLIRLWYLWNWLLFAHGKGPGPD